MTSQTVDVADHGDLAAVTSASRVFAIPELFEAILTHSSIRDLIVSQMVSAKWASTISTSPALQQKMFFTPTSSYPYERESNSDPRVNTLLSSLFAPFFRSDESENYAWNNCRWLPPISWFQDETRRAKFLRPEASWRKMYPIQPARMIGKIDAEGGCGCGSMEREVWGVKEKLMGKATNLEGGEARSGNGATTMGFLYDLIIWIVDEWPEVEYWIDLGIPKLESSSDGSSENSVDGDELLEDDALPESDGSVEEDDSEGPETGPFRTYIRHSQECYSMRGKKFAPSGLMVHKFEEDPIELLESNEQ